jgi:hypothetical protein
VTFVRRAGNEAVLVAINFSNRPFTGSVQAQKLSLDAWEYKIISHR